MIAPPVSKSSKTGETFVDLVEVVEKEHKRLLARKSIIEKRKEDQERQLLEMVRRSHFPFMFAWDIVVSLNVSNLAWLAQEREEEAKRLKIQKITEEAEQRRLATEFEQMKNERILREIEQRELEEAEAFRQEAEKRGGRKKGKKPILEGVSHWYP